MPVNSSVLNNNSEALFEQGCRLIQNGNAAEATDVFKKLLLEESNHVGAHSKLGVCFVVQGNLDRAMALFKKAIELDDQFQPAYNNLALAMAQNEDYEQAVEVAVQGLGVDDAYLPLYSTIAFALKPLGRVGEAISYLQKAVSLNNKDVQILSNLSGLLLENGQAEEAKGVLEDIISADPYNAEAHRMLSSITKYDDVTPHLEQLKQVSQAPGLSPEGLSDIHFALGKAYENMKDFEQSFHHYKIGNESYRHLLNYNIQTDKNFFDQIKQVFTADLITNNQQAVCGKNIIFILGMPRSGTSLVEQILASHPDVYGSGELNFLDALQFRQQSISKENYVQSITSLTPDSFEEMASSYLKKVSKLAGNQSVITDKMPHNFRYIGLIKTLFPNAKIIHCSRNPKDVYLSIFKTRFVGQLDFAYDLNEIVEYYALYEDMMNHWREVMPNSIYELSYEDLVSNIEKNTRELLDYCALDWADECLSPHKTKRAVTTASSQQVREPIHSGAVAYWKNYPMLFDFL